MPTPQKTCASIDCPERRSVCCKAKPKEFTKIEGGGHFICSSCGIQYEGGKCIAGDTTCDMPIPTTPTERPEWEARWEKEIGEVLILTGEETDIELIKSFIRSTLASEREAIIGGLRDDIEHLIKLCPLPSGAQCDCGDGEWNSALSAVLALLDKKDVSTIDKGLGEIIKE